MSYSQPDSASASASTYLAPYLPPHYLPSIHPSTSPPPFPRFLRPFPPLFHPSSPAFLPPSPTPPPSLPSLSSDLNSNPHLLSFPHFISTCAPNASKPRTCRSIGRAPMLHPPGRGTTACPCLPTNAPITKKLARNFRTTSAHGSTDDRDDASMRTDDDWPSMFR